MPDQPALSADTVRVIETLDIPAADVLPFDVIAEGRRVYQTVHGMFDFGNWPLHSREPGVQLHVATTYAEVEMVELGDGNLYPMKRPVHEDPEVILKRAGDVMRVMRGVPIPERPAHIDGHE
jgi:hypothetical protein